MKNLFIKEKKLSFGKDKYEVIEKSDVLIILTDWEEFKKANLKKIKKLMK